MEVILLEKVRNLGSLGEKVNVKPGYARNYLMPKRKAISATENNLAKFEERRADLEKQALEIFEKAKERAEKIAALASLTISAMVAEEGKLYGSIGVIDIAEAFNQAGVSVEKSEIKLPEGPIRHIGEYEVHLYLHTDVAPIIKVNVVPE